MPERTLRGIQQALSRSSETDVTRFLLVVALVALVLCLTALLVRQVQSRHRLVAAWKGLAEKMLQLGLTREERGLVREFAKREAPWTPMEVLQNIDVFEGAVHRYLEGVASSSRPLEPSAEAAGRVRSVRMKLGFQRPPGILCFSTRELEAGQEVRLRIPGGKTPSELSARATGRREDLLELAELRPADEGLRGRRVDAVFFRGSRAFGFQSEVVEVDASRATCLLKHSVQVTPGGLREFQRVPLDKAVTFRAKWEGPGVCRQGTARDLSGGGLSLLCPCYYETGEQLVLNITPGRWFGGEEGEHEKLPEDRQIVGSIVDTQRTGDGRCVHHVGFLDVTDEERGYLLGLVRRVELSTAKAQAAE